MPPDEAARMAALGGQPGAQQYPLGSAPAHFFPSIPADFDESLIPEALGILGFDLESVPSLSAAGFTQALVGSDANDDNHTEEDSGKSGDAVVDLADGHFDAAEGVNPRNSKGRSSTSTEGEGEPGQAEAQVEKKRRAGGGNNQREVQRRYRERKKERTKELEKQVEALKARLKDMESAEAAKNSAGVAAIAAGLAEGTAMRECSIAHNAEKEDAAVRQFGEGVDRLKVLLDRGAADGEIRSLLSTMSVEVCTRLLTPESNYGRAMMHRHAKILNDESANSGEAGAGELVLNGGVSVGFLKANPSDNPYDKSMWTLGDVDAREHWNKVVDYFENVVPPNEVNELIAWRNEYIAGLSAIYKRRQALGVQLAFIGPKRDESALVTASPRMELSPSPGATIGGAVAAAAPPPSEGQAMFDSFGSHLSIYNDTMSIIERLKASVAEELKFKQENTAQLIRGRVQARTCAHITVLSYPLLPDPLAVASEIVRRRNRRQAVGS